jgi:hypothetical protein
MGIFCIQVYFLTAPTPVTIVTMLQAMTGLVLAGPAPEGHELALTHPTHPAHPVRLGWWTDRQQGHAQLEATLQVQVPLPFPTYPACIELEAEPLNTQAHRYLRNVTLAALLQLDGVVEQPFTLPSWANRPWQQVPPRRFWQRIESLYLLRF